MIQIPTFILSYNRLGYLLDTLESLRRFPGLVPIVLDNASTYPPLLEWMGNPGNDDNYVPIIRFKGNHSVVAPWMNLGGVSSVFTRGSKVDISEINMGKYSDSIVELVTKIEEFSHGYYIVMDNDLDFSLIPDNGFNVLLEIFHYNKELIKCGFGVEIDSIPDSYPLKSEVQKWERQFWANRTPDFRFPGDAKDPGKQIEVACYRAAIDTTPALYNASRPFDYNLRYEPAVRLGSPYVVIHRPWMKGVEDWDHEDWYYHRQTQVRTMWTENMKGYLHSKGLDRSE